MSSDAPAPDAAVAGTRAQLDDGAADDEHDPVPASRRRLSPGVRNLIEWVVVIGGAIVITILLRTFAFQTYYIPSSSMVPTLQVQDRLVVNKITDDFNVGDIVVFDRPETWNAVHDVLIKRIVATEGQTIEIRAGVLHRDGVPIDEPYLPEGITLNDFAPVVVPEGQVFVMGDNRNASSDSRESGPVPEENIVGRAALRIWPLSEFGGL